MPFTISHAAAVLPFSRLLARWRLLSATLIGSMVPDFAWFLPWAWRPGRIETHSTLSLFTFSLPVGLAVFWIFQRVIKTPLMEVLPDGAHARWQAFEAPADYAEPLQWVLAACGVLAGAVCHLVWDSFTHREAFGMRMVPALDDAAVAIGNHHLMGTWLLQDVNSLVGLVAVIALCAYSLRGGRAPAPAAPRRLGRRERRIWASVYVLTAIMVSGALLLSKYPSLTAVRNLRLQYPVESTAIALLRGLAVALLGVSLCLKVRLTARPGVERAG